MSNTVDELAHALDSFAVTLAPLIAHIASFLLGVVSGIIIQWVRFRYLVIKDLWDDLRPLTEGIYGIVSDLHSSSEYALRLQNKNLDEFDRTIDLINELLTRYRVWYSSLGDGGVEKMSQIDKELSSALAGASHYARFSQKDRRYVEQHLLRFHDIISTCRHRLGEFNKGRIPHYVLFGRKKMKNWSECRF